MVGYEIDLLAESADVVKAWPDTKKHTGRFLGRTPPLALHLVAVDPIVLVGASKEIGGETDVSVFSNIFMEIPITTKIGLEGDDILVLVENNGDLEKHELKAAELPKIITLGANDDIVINRSDTDIVVSR